MTGDERDLMREAMRLAAPYHPHPNPRVGSVIVDEAGTIIGRGAHQARGTHHAEVHAIADAGAAARGATMVVTLEPCSFHGATPPCTDAVIAAGISRVIVGASDPDNRVAGAGIAALEAAGVIVEVAESGEAESVDPGYFHHRRTGRPRVTLKMAATLDGQAAAADGSSQWITSEAARADVHRLRANSDAVMVGAGTLLADDPRLTARGHDAPTDRPMPVIVGGGRPLPPSAQVFTRPSLVYAPHQAVVPNAEVAVIAGPHGVDLAAMMADLGSRGIVDLLVEGGPRLAGALIRDRLVDRIVWYIGAGVAGGVGVPAVGGVFGTMSELRSIDIVSTS